eukprot:SAG31_NODE_1416_length_8441_cov_11.436706_5_plen_257_part_00
MPGNIIMCPQDAPIAGAATPAKLCTAYWDIRGLAQPIRLVLEYVGADFDDIRIDAGPLYTKPLHLQSARLAPRLNAPAAAADWRAGPGAPGEPAYKGHWFDAKPDIGVNFANLPYMIDGELRLVQSNAILRHLGRKFNLMGASAEEHAMLDVLLDQGADFDNEFTGLCYRGWTEEKKTVYLVQLCLQRLFVMVVADSYPSCTGQTPNHAGHVGLSPRREALLGVRDADGRRLQGRRDSGQNQSRVRSGCACECPSY